MQLPKRHYQLANTDKWISPGEYNGTKGGMGACGKYKDKNSLSHSVQKELRLF